MNGEEWLIKLCSSVHLAPRIPGAVSIDPQATAIYMDSALPETTAGMWTFYWYSGTEAEALAFANSINTFARYQE